MKAWTQTEDHMLRSFYAVRGSRVMAQLFHRTRQAVTTRAHQLRIERFPYGPRVRLRVPIEQLNACADDAARRLLLGKSQQEEA